MVVSLADVQAAARQLQGQVVLTPCLPSQRLSELLGCQITLKFETFPALLVVQGPRRLRQAREPHARRRGRAA